jgi:hypothetical protein
MFGIYKRNDVQCAEMREVSGDIVVHRALNDACRDTGQTDSFGVVVSTALFCFRFAQTANARLGHAKINFGATLALRICRFSRLSRKLSFPALLSPRTCSGAESPYALKNGGSKPAIFKSFSEREMPD